MNNALNPESDDDTNLLLDNYIEINRLAFDQLSSDYLNRANSKSVYETPASVLIAHVLDFFDSGTGLEVLEVGPGSGEALSVFQANCCVTTAVELSEAIIKIAITKSPHTKFIRGNILDSNFDDRQFDIIFAGALIHLFPKQHANKLLTLFANWLKKDGVLFISTTVNDLAEEGFFIKSDYNHAVTRFRKKWTEPEFKSFIEDRFDIVKTIHTNETDRDKKWVAHLCKHRI